VIARIRALLRKTDTDKARLDINQTVQEVVILMQDDAVRKGVALRMELAADVLPVLGDRVQLQQVILNLVMNGLEAMSGVTDRSRELLIRSVKQESDKVLIAVRDSGIGLQPRSLDHLFKAFLRQSRKEWVWGWRSVAPLLRITAGGSGRQRIPTKVRRFSSPCRPVAGIRMIEALTN
jgi:signal transduction histidine kinase